MVHYLDKDGSTILCKMHSKQFGSFGDGVYQKLVSTSKKPADFALPLYDQADPLNRGS